MLALHCLSLCLNDVFKKNSLVLEDITLHLEVEIVVKVGINLSSIAIALEEATKNANASNPEDLAVKTSFSGTAALTSA